MGMEKCLKKSKSELSYAQILASFEFVLYPISTECASERAINLTGFYLRSGRFLDHLCIQYINLQSEDRKPKYLDYNEIF